MIKGLLLTELASGYFSNRSSDDKDARLLSQGQLVLGDRELNVMSSSTFDDLTGLPRVHKLALVSFRWIDVLRRSKLVDLDSDETWLRVFEAWSSSSSAQDPSSDAWRPIPLEQRAIAMALGAPNTGGMRESITLHIERVGDLVLKDASAIRRLQLLRVQLALMSRRGDSERDLQCVALKAASLAFTEDGYAIAKDLSEMQEASQKWRTLFEQIGVNSDHEVFSRLVGTDFWRHALAPDGSLIPIGGELPEVVPGSETPQTRYILTGGAEGSAPDKLSRIDKTGLVSLRSGWGETETDARDETLITLMLGPVRDRTAHQDPGRITFHSQGRGWIIDPVDEIASGKEMHSIVDVEGVRYRVLGGANLARHYADDQVEGLLVSTNVYQQVQWQRHVIFARTGNYLIVEDVIRSSASFKANLQWMVSPDVNIEPTSRGFLLHSDAKTVALHISTGSLKDYSIDEVRSAAGHRIAWRIRVPLPGNSSRVVSIISDVEDSKIFHAYRVPRSGKEFTVELRDKNLDETLVITPEISAIMPSNLDTEEAVNRTVAYGAEGNLEPAEALEQRVLVRAAIQEVKDTVRAEGGDVSSRLRGINSLISIGTELRVSGLRDHAFGTALIDIAGTELRDQISNHPQVGNLRRSPLVRFADEQLLQPSYSVPVLTTLDSGSVPAGSTSSFIWSVDLGQLVPSAYIHDAPGNVLTVYCHGATDRTKFTMPRYERLRSMSSMGLGPVMFLSDPCLDLDSRMILSWYVGTEDMDLHQEMAQMIDAYARKKGIEKILLVGNSGGGFAVLQLAAYLKGTRVVSFNPQIQVDRYVPRIAQTAHWALFGRNTVSDSDTHAPRMDLIKRYEQISFEQDVLLIQNPGDDHHYKDHFIPFTSAFSKSPGSHRIRTLTPYLGPGHRVPSPAEYMRIVHDEATAENEMPWTYQGLRANR
ncbi:alpha/beta fold hydrolase [Glutamicibacter sp.]|uniref:alpha/beta fold hydrolase n=1 Tax=Glutamicibacter sp. TaxID=1931995 RepID=UPI002FE184AB